MNAAKTHLSINVSNVERSVRFYEAFFGVPAHKRRPGYANFDLDTPPLKLALNETTVSKGGALNHLGILVSSVADVDAARKRLTESGLATFDENDVTCCFAKQDKVWVHDPDGNAWEVYSITDDMLEDTKDAEDAEETGETEVTAKTAKTATTAKTEACCQEGCCGSGGPSLTLVCK